MYWKVFTYPLYIIVSSWVFVSVTCICVTRMPYMGADSLSRNISICSGVPGETFSSPVTRFPPWRTPTPRTGWGASVVKLLVISTSLQSFHSNFTSKGINWNSAAGGKSNMSRSCIYMNLKITLKLWGSSILGTHFIDIYKRVFMF